MYKEVTSHTHEFCKTHLANFPRHFKEIMLRDARDGQGGESRHTHMNKSCHTHTKKSRHRHTNPTRCTLQTSSATSTGSCCMIREIVRAASHVTPIRMSHITHIQRSYVTHTQILQHVPCKLPRALRRDHFARCAGW